MSRRPDGLQPPRSGHLSREPDWRHWIRFVQAQIPSSGLTEESRDDIAQEALLAFVAKRLSIRDPERWLRRVVRRIFVGHLRRRYRRRPVDTITLADDSVAARTSPPEVVLGLKEVLQRMPDNLAAVLVLSERDGLTADEIAASLGLTRAEVYLRKRRAVRRLRRELGWQ